jgi:hypothetical protein
MSGQVNIKTKWVDEKINNSKIKKECGNVDKWKYCTTLWLLPEFQKASIYDNVHQSPSPRGGGGASATQPKPGTTEYHKDKAEMICNVAVKHMQGWWGTI